MKQKSMQYIAKFVEKKANEQLSTSPKIEEILKAKEALRKYSSAPIKEFTFTVGEVNAYMG
jgi:CO dehydrogenase/acetyl-CoA synthase gamma subunit (corrinoid Fe-S protein)